MSPETFNRLKNTSKEDFDRFVDWLFSHSLAELRAARGDPEATEAAWINYFRRGIKADLLLDELMTYLPELLRRTQYAEYDVPRIVNMIKSINTAEIGISPTEPGTKTNQSSTSNFPTGKQLEASGQCPMTHQALFLAYLHAYNTKGVSTMLSFFHDDCLFENISAGNVTVRTQGKAELESLARKSAAAFASREQKVLSLTQEQNRIVAEIDYHAVLQADLTPELKAGTRLDLHGVSVLEFSAGKIIRLSDYI